MVSLGYSLEAAIESLPSWGQREVARRRCGYPVESRDDIASGMRITRERVRTLERQAKRAIRRSRSARPTETEGINRTEALILHRNLYGAFPDFEF